MDCGFIAKKPLGDSVSLLDWVCGYLRLYTPKLDRSSGADSDISVSREPLEAYQWAIASADTCLEGVQRVNGAQTVEPRATSGGTTRYSDWTDAPRALIVPNAAYEAVVALPKAPPPLFGECFCRRAP